MASDCLRAIESQLLDEQGTACLHKGVLSSRYSISLHEGSSVLSSLLSQTPSLKARYVTYSDGVIKLKNEGDDVWSLGSGVVTKVETGPSLVQPSTLCRKRPRSDRSKVTSGALEKEDQGLKSNPFGQKRVKTSAASFFTDSASKSAPPKKSKFDTTKVKGSKAKKGKEKAKPPPALEEKKISKAEKSKRKVFDEDSDEEEEGEVDDDGTGFLDVSVDSSKDESKLTKGGGANGDDFEGDESSDDEHEKVSPKEKIEEAEPEPTIPNEKVYGAMDGFATAPKPAAAVGEVVNGKRRVTKKRFVEREEMDGKGYMHTTTVEETYEEWEVVEEAKVKMPVRSGVKGGGKKAGKVQKGLMGFFTKK